MTDALAAVLPDARLDTLAGQGHEGMTTAPQLYAQATMRFLLAGSSDAVGAGFRAACAADVKDRYVGRSCHAKDLDDFQSGMQAARYPDMLRMVESGKLHPGKLVRGTVSIEQASDVLTDMASYNTVGMHVITG